jgi:hypothetical protein
VHRCPVVGDFGGISRPSPSNHSQTQKGLLGMRLRRQRRAVKFIHPHAAAVECCRTALPAAVNRETLAADSRECPKAKMAITSCGVMVMESPYQSQLRSTCSCGCSTKKTSSEHDQIVFRESCVRGWTISAAAQRHKAAPWPSPGQPGPGGQ